MFMVVFELPSVQRRMSQQFNILLVQRNFEMNIAKVDGLVCGFAGYLVCRVED